MPNPGRVLVRITSVTDISRARARGVLAGLLSGTVGVSIGYLVAGLTGPVGSPVVAVAQLLIDLSPPAAKDFAIRNFGTHDKLVLQIGVLVVLAAFAAVIGVLAQRSLALGVAGVGLFAVVGTIAAGTRPTATAVDIVPSLAGAVAAGFALTRLTAAATGPASRAGGGDGPQPPPRRQFLGLAAATGGAAAVAYVGGRLLTERASVAAAQATLRLPAAATPAPPIPAGTNLGIPGLSPFITPNSAFYRVDTAIVLPQIPPSSWRLRIHGMVARELELTFDDLIRRPLIEDYITLTCVSNPVAGPYIGNARWLGASLRALLQEAGIRSGADQLFCTSADGFTSGTPVQTAMDGRDALLAVAMNGQPLPVAHGFPVRTVVPGLYGYVSACKWITDIEVTRYASNVAYWAQRGWSAQAPIKTESRIDLPVNGATLRRGRHVIAGVAWAQHKGIDAVEVRVGSGPWQRARLAAVPGIDCWRQWAVAWDATPGRHTIQARATDATGYTQTAQLAAPAPNGASGYPQVIVTVTG